MGVIDTCRLDCGKFKKRITYLHANDAYSSVAKLRECVADTRQLHTKEYYRYISFLNCRINRCTKRN